ncbi:MAG TPA: PAS domain S-box protein [Gemmatimonadaceae bacterium]|nr:PAS domain S-box protein [Gemmatimonadaceae bacterium]
MANEHSGDDSRYEAARALERAERADAVWPESEARFQTVANLVHDLLWQSDPDGVVTWFNDPWHAFTGQTRAQASGFGWMDAIHPDDREAARRPWTESAEERRPPARQQRIRDREGEYRWFHVRAAPVRDEAGRVLHWFGAATDVHEERRATAALVESAADLNALRRQLSLAEEEERRRLARELHDEVGQHLTALGLGLQALSDVAPPGSDADRRATQLRGLAETLGRELHGIAVRLRPRALDDFGLEEALRSYAVEWSRQSAIVLDLHVHGKSERLPSEVESATYRIVQEALTNVARHSGASRAGVVLERRDGYIHVIVEDDGRGFDPNGVAATRGEGAPALGLLGIRERATLVGGTMQIESKPGKGTALFVHVPIEPRRNGPNGQAERGGGDVMQIALWTDTDGAAR